VSRRALLISYEPAHFVELARVARLLKASGTWEPVFYFAKMYADTPGRIEVCRSEGWSVRGEPEAAPATEPRLSIVESLVRAVPSRLKKLADWPWRYRAFRGLLHAAAAHAGSVLDEVRPALVVLPEDNVDHLTPVMVKVAAARGIPTVIVPFTVANHLEPAEAFFGNPAYTLGRIGRALFARYPWWIAEHRGAQLVRMPVPEALALQHSGYAPPQPWILNSGDARAIAVESEAMHAHYRACGLPASQLVLTGALYDDVLAAATRDADETHRELGLDARPVFLCALPPDQIATRPPGTCAYATHEDLVRAWIDTLVRDDVQVVVSLHPRTPAGAVQFVEGLGAKLAQIDVARLIPMCDVYVSSASATIRMAIACGKPVINYDVYRYDYTDYAGVPGVFTMTSHDEFATTVARLAKDRSETTASVMQRWANLDGRAGERMLALFESLVE
jgi:hypothetical protein